jgi:hypothetical protein
MNANGIGALPVIALFSTASVSWTRAGIGGSLIPTRLASTAIERDEVRAW